MSESKKFKLSQNKMLAGVCGGIAEYLDKDASMIRILYVLATLFTGTFMGVIAYIVIWVICSNEKK